MVIYIPAHLIRAYESNQEKLKFQDLKDKKYEEIKNIRKRGEVIQKIYIQFIKTELAIETIFQIAGQILLLLQSRTSSPTVSGLETVFGKSSNSFVSADVLIILSIAWSMKTVVTLNLKAADVEKTHLRFKTKVCLILTSLLSSSARLLSIISFFTPFIGLFSLLNHHKAEQIPFGPSKTGELKPDDQITIDNRTFTWGKVDRWTFENDTETAPEYNLYTYFTLGQSFAIFSCLVFLQFIAVFTVKLTRVKKFRQANILNKFIHSTDNLTIASPFEDFDVLDGTEKEHRERFQKVNTEVLMTMAVNMIFHLVMLAPLWYTGKY